MKYLVIDRSLAYYTVDASVQPNKPIDKITKEDLMKLVELSLTDDFEMDPFDKNKLKNAAHAIIYKNIYQKLHALKNQKNKFMDEKAAMYRNAIDDYKVVLGSKTTLG